MRLFLESGDVFDDPDDALIAEHLPGEEFAILSESDDSMTYLQFAERADRPWDLVLEYQDGSPESHFEASDAPLTMERVVSAFQKYARGDLSWHADFAWECVTVDPSEDDAG